MPALNKLKSTLLVCSGGLSVFSALSIYNGSEPFHEKFVLPLVHKLDPETSHNIALTAAKFGLIGQSKFKDPDSLVENHLEPVLVPVTQGNEEGSENVVTDIDTMSKTKVWQLNFSNPLGIAAGFDKQGEAVEGLHKIGLGFVEVGSVTPFPQPGNDKPRVFRLEKDEAIINRYGFNSEGHDVVYDRLKKVRSKDGFKGVIGVNLGKNRISDDPVGDYVKGIKKFGDVADYLVINISSPNTPGLRTWQKKQQLRELLTGLVAARDELPGPNKPPLLLKLAPDLTQEERKDIASVLQDKKCSVDGLVISNTTVERLPTLQSENVGEEGGLSGRPLSEPSTRLIEDMYKLTKGQIPIIGVGGIFSGRDAYEKIRAGASLIQLYTSFIYHGPPRVTRIKKELDEHLRSDGFHNIAEAVGKGNYLK